MKRNPGSKNLLSMCCLQIAIFYDPVFLKCVKIARTDMGLYFHPTLFVRLLLLFDKQSRSPHQHAQACRPLTKR